MLDNFNSDNFNDNDVLSVKDKTFKISKVKNAIKNTFASLANKLHENLYSQDIKIEPVIYIDEKEVNNSLNWFNEGISCEVLKTDGQGWQSGKMRLKVTLEFISDQLEKKEVQEKESSTSQSPLNDLRVMINKLG